MSKNYAGIDFGSGRIRVAELSDPKHAAHPTILSHGGIDVPPTVLSNGTVIEEEPVARLLRTLWADHDIGTKHVRIGMGATAVIIRELTMPRLPKHRIRETLPFHVADQLPYPVTDAVLDFLPVAPVPTDNTLMSGLLVAARKDEVRANVLAVTRAGLRVDSVDVIPFATARLVSRNGTDQAVTALVDIGATSTTMTVLIGGKPQFVRIIPTGGDAITQRLANDLGIDPRRADGLKARMGMTHRPATRPEQVAVDSIVGGATELIAAIANTLQYFSTTKTTTVSAIQLLGGGSTLTGLTDALTAATQLPTNFARPFGKLTFGPRADEAHARAHTAEYAVALGLAMREHE